MIKKLSKHSYFLFFLTLGLLIFTYPMLITNFDIMPGNGYDVKSFGYILEHIRLWVYQIYPHQSLWDAPFYYPIKNSLAFSDTLFGIAPFYIILRFFLSPLSSIQGILVVMCVLNYATFYYLLNKQLKFSPLASALGSFIFAFGLSRYYRTVHLNYLSQFYSILSIIFLLKVNINNTKLKNYGYFLLFTIFLVLQCYSCYALTFYLCLAGLFAIIIGLTFKDIRLAILNFFKRFYSQIISSIIIGLSLLYPLAHHYLIVNAPRTLDSVFTYLQTPLAWYRSLSILDSLVFNFSKTLPYIDKATSEEFSCSIGIITTLIALFGIYKFKKAKWLTYIVLFFIFLCSCKVFNFILWEYLYHIIPGAQGIRAIIRFSYITLIILSIAIAYYIDYLRTKNSNILYKLLLVFSIFIITIEQIPYKKDINSAWETYQWSKSEFIKEISNVIVNIPDEAKVINIKTDVINYQDISPYYEDIKKSLAQSTNDTLAIWCALLKRKYSFNGFSGLHITYPEDQFDNMYTITITRDMGHYHDFPEY